MSASFKLPQPGDPAWLRDAFAHLGLAEIPGPQHNDQLIAIFAEIGFPEIADDETAWCAAFANWVLQRAGRPTTGKLTARSFIGYGAAAAEPRRGDLVVIKRGSSSWQGHVFFWLAQEGEFIWGIGGNQGRVGAVSVARFKADKLLAIRRPPAAVAAAAEAPVPAERNRPPAAAYAHELVEAIQQALLDRGYPEVGQVDGVYGDKTRKAILAFEDDHEMALTGLPSGELLAAILSAAAKAQPAARAEASPAEVREKVPEVKATWQAKVAAFWGMVITAGTGLAGFVAEAFGEVRRLVRPVLEALGDVPWWAYAALFGGGLLFVWLRTRAGEQAQVEAFRAGERR